MEKTDARAKQIIESAKRDTKVSVDDEKVLLMVIADTYQKLEDLDFNDEISPSLKDQILYTVGTINAVFNSREVMFGSEIIHLFGRLISIIYSDIDRLADVYCTPEEGPAFTMGFLPCDVVESAFTMEDLAYIVASWRVNYVKYFDTITRAKLVTMCQSIEDYTEAEIKGYEERNLY